MIIVRVDIDGEDALVRTKDGVAIAVPAARVRVRFQPWEQKEKRYRGYFATEQDPRIGVLEPGERIYGEDW